MQARRWQLARRVADLFGLPDMKSKIEETRLIYLLLNQNGSHFLPTVFSALELKKL